MAPCWHQICTPSCTFPTANRGLTVPPTSDVEPLQLPPLTAADLMSATVVTLRPSATVADALLLFTQKGIHAAPVVDDAGRAAGVVSVSDLLIHEREAVANKTQRRNDSASISEVMTPAIITIDHAAPAAKVIEKMLGTKVHQLFVVDSAGKLIGVITPLDILAHLHAEVTKSS
jgi:CBS-domain-containing membrane protein